MKAKLSRSISLLILANLVVVALLVSTLVVDLFGSTTPGHPSQAEPSSSPAATFELMPMGLAHIPTSSSCLLCHEAGGEAGLKPIPAIGHPLEGWTRCVVCHTNDRLGRTAPGHAGIPEGECRNCHQVAPEGPAITQPHSRLQDPHCLDCHGTYAHLSTSMVGKRQDECWLCHKPTALPPPQYPHREDAHLTCRSCHQSSEVGGLPIDHALRADTTCLLCHDIRIAAAPPTPAP